MHTFAHIIYNLRVVGCMRMFIMCVVGWCVQASTYPGSRQRILYLYIVGCMYVRIIGIWGSFVWIFCLSSVYHDVVLEYFLKDLCMRLVAGRRAEINILYRERVCICWCGKKTCMLNVSQHYALELPASSSAYELLSLAKSNTIFSRGFFLFVLVFVGSLLIIIYIKLVYIWYFFDVNVNQVS